MERENEKGQAIFEFLVFVPFILGLFSIFINVLGAINGSINQQKATRGYYYNILKQNSMFPGNIDLNGLGGISSVNFFALGYRERSSGGGKTSFAPCYKMQSLLSEGSSENCDNPDTSGGETQFIRVYTSYGICGPTLSDAGDGFFHNLQSAHAGGCANR